MGFASNGTYTPPNGAENATPGQTIASATWNAIFTDLASALTTLGAISANTIVGNNTGSTALATQLTVPQVQAMLAPTNISYKAIAVPLSVTGDTQIAITLPTGISSYVVSGIRLANNTGSGSGSTVGLYTAAHQTGTTIITSTAVTITATAFGAANSAQLITPASVNTVMFNASVLFFCVVAPTTGPTAASTDVTLTITPLF